MGAVAAVAGSLFSPIGLVGVAGAAAKSAFKKPDVPEVKSPTPMPDPLEQQKAREKSIIEQMSRRGRSASILTEPGSSQTLGG